MTAMPARMTVPPAALPAPMPVLRLVAAPPAGEDGTSDGPESSVPPSPAVPAAPASPIAGGPAARLLQRLADPTTAAGPDTAALAAVMLERIARLAARGGAFAGIRPSVHLQAAAGL